jgi:hypothetical protein
VWRLTMLLLSLIAALSGTPLRQAEAASDFVRALAELGEGHVEVIDGGVGDDANVSVLKAGCDIQSLRAMTPLTTAEGHLRPVLTAALSLPEFGHQRPFDRAPTCSSGSLRPHAWLQCFLF